MEVSEETLRQYERDVETAKSQSAQTQSTYASAMFSQGQKQNLIEYELDFRPELEDIERLLRCDIIVREKDGSEHWEPNPDKTKVFFNDLGVNDIIRNIIIIVNKGKALSNYDHTEINDRVRQMKHEIRVLIYNQYEQYGMDNEYKMNNYSMIVLSIGSIIEDVYRRAMNGETHKGLSEQRIVTQNESFSPMQNTFQNQNSNKGSSHWWNPYSWGK